MIWNLRVVLVGFALVLAGVSYCQLNALGPSREFGDLPQNLAFTDFRATFEKVNGRQLWLPKSARFAVFDSEESKPNQSDWHEVGWVWKSEKLGRLIGVTGIGRLVPVVRVVEYRQPMVEDISLDSYIPSMRLGGSGGSGGFDTRRGVFVFWAMGEKDLVEKFIEKEGDRFSAQYYDQLDDVLLADRRIDYFYALKLGDLDVAEAIAELCERAGAERPRYDHGGTLPFTGKEMLSEVRFWREAKRYTEKDFDRLRSLPEDERIKALIRFIDMRPIGFDWWSAWQNELDRIGEVAVEPLIEALSTQNHMLPSGVGVSYYLVHSKRTVIQLALQRLWKGFPMLISQEIPGYDVAEVDRLKSLWREQRDLPLGDRLASWLVAEDWQRVSTILDPYSKRHPGIPEWIHVTLPEISEIGRRKIVGGIGEKLNQWIEGRNQQPWLNSIIPLLIAADKDSARENLKKVSEKHLKELKKWSRYNDDQNFALLTIFRIEAGDQEGALTNYYETVPWLLETKEDGSKVFIVASAFPEIRELQDFTRNVLNQWLEKVLQSKELRQNYHQLTLTMQESQFIDSPGVRAFWLDCLDRKDPIGSIIVRENGAQILYGTDYAPGGEKAPGEEAEPLLLCEFVAMELAFCTEVSFEFDRAGRLKAVTDVKQAVASNRFRR